MRDEEKTCWTCGWDTRAPVGTCHDCKPAYESAAVEDWANEHATGADGMPGSGSPPCPGWKPRTTVGALAPTTGPRFGADGGK